jgi:HSP90 family molecular chaperone
MDLWSIVALVIAAGVSFLIGKFGLGGKILGLFGVADKVKVAIEKLYTTISDAFKPEPDGSVKLTADEVTAIKVALKELLVLFKIDLPI